MNSTNSLITISIVILGALSPPSANAAASYICKDVPEPPGYTSGQFFNINNESTVTASVVTAASASAPYEFSYAKGWVPLPPPPAASGYRASGASVSPIGINDLGTVVGGASIYPSTPPTNVGSEQGYSQIVASGAYDFLRLWTPSAGGEPATTPYTNFTNTEFDGVNNSGLMVGLVQDPSASSSTPYPTVTEAGIVYNPTSGVLETFSPGYTTLIPPPLVGDPPVISKTLGLNNHGWLVGTGANINNPRFAYLYNSVASEFTFLTVPSGLIVGRAINDLDPNSSTNCTSASCFQMAGWISAVSLPAGTSLYDFDNAKYANAAVVDFDPTTGLFQQPVTITCSEAGISRAIASELVGINNYDIVSGYWYDASENTHPLLAFPVAKPTVLAHGVAVFDIAIPGAGVPVFLDPSDASAYEYTTGRGNPAFQSVTLPEGFGAGSKHIYLFADGRLFSLTPGEQFNFQKSGFPNGVRGFIIIGFNPRAASNTPSAFVTEVTFVSKGQFTGRVTPLL